MNGWVPRGKRGEEVKISKEKIEERREGSKEGEGKITGDRHDGGKKEYAKCDTEVE